MIEEFFALNSYPALSTDRPFQDKFILLFKIYGIIFLLNFISVPISFLAEHLVTQVLHLKSIHEQYTTSMSRLFAKFGYLQVVFYICIMAPIIEESIFRLPLSFKRSHIAVAFGFALVVLARLIPGLSQQNLAINILVRVALFAAGYFALYKSLPEIKVPNKRLQTGLMITSIVVFGLVHIFNYAPLQWNIIFIYPLFVIPQLCMGWMLTYIRFKNGFFWGMGLHALINSVSMLIYTVFKHKM
ncbi:CPBP family glutamic-type intramembrane protease [Mucilaginibacter aquariorum]|uniref:CPBP family glutamic-type intramembrane protease n=1 Tax=Mucilaginibacter aquariorum TaxID=2967225 RepID=A0ABT1T4X1_9SPHI|nr:CPBP family glutamic-type intramembrane protease [Mucilaginibacter aquariorum]MCQ6959465.1 CPBP family glutamic-type intramembrane protease [Mucilaginibacter aquariorum]